MIHEALSFLCSELNAYLRNALALNEDKAVLSAIVNRDGSVPVIIENKVVCTLVNIEEERVSRNMSFDRPANAGAFATNTPINLNLSVLCSANFDDHSEALRFISHTIAFFHDRNVFARQNAPTLPEQIEKLIVELQNMTNEESCAMWKKLGANYMPSVVYKVRMLVLKEGVITDIPPVVDAGGNL